MSATNNLNLQSYVSAKEVAAIALHLSQADVDLDGKYSRIVRALCELYLHQHNIKQVPSTEAALAILHELNFSTTQFKGPRSKGLLTAMQKENLSAESSDQDRITEILTMMDPPEKGS